jgi:hypothetical protein
VINFFNYKNIVFSLIFLLSITAIVFGFNKESKNFGKVEINKWIVIKEISSEIHEREYISAFALTEDKKFDEDYFLQNWVIVNKSADRILVDINASLYQEWSLADGRSHFGVGHDEFTLLVFNRNGEYYFSEY